MLFHKGNIVAIKYSHDSNEMAVIKLSGRATLGGSGMPIGSGTGLMPMTGTTWTMTMAVLSE